MLGWFKPKPATVARNYIDAMNARDADGVDALLADDCRFIDSRGYWLEGRANVMEATRNFFALEANFRWHDVTMVMHNGDVLMRGRATANDARLARDTLWQARVVDGKIVHWQSFGAGDPVSLIRILLPEEAQASS